MSLHDAVHVLLDVAAGRRNLSAAEADELHDEIDNEQAPDPTPAAGGTTTPTTTDAPVPATPEGVNLDAPADA